MKTLKDIVKNTLKIAAPVIALTFNSGCIHLKYLKGDKTFTGTVEQDYIYDAGVYLHVMGSEGEGFWDVGKYGMGNESTDGYSLKNKDNTLGEQKLIKEVSSEKQLEVAKEYTNLLVEIMNKKGYGDY